MAGNSQQDEQDVNFIEKNLEKINIKSCEGAEGGASQNTPQLTNCSRCGSRPSKPDKYCDRCSTNVAEGKITKKVSHGKTGGKSRDKLPPLILSQIMTFLSESELKTCTEVSREFRRKAEKELSSRVSNEDATV